MSGAGSREDFMEEESPRWISGSEYFSSCRAGRHSRSHPGLLHRPVLGPWDRREAGRSLGTVGPRQALGGDSLCEAPSALRLGFEAGSLAAWLGGFLLAVSDIFLSAVPFSVPGIKKKIRN